LQAICRTNRPFPGKSHGLIVDYLGVCDDVGRALMFDEKSIRLVITNLEELKAELSKICQKCVDYFPGVDPKSRSASSPESAGTRRIPSSSPWASGWKN